MCRFLLGMVLALLLAGCQTTAEVQVGFENGASGPGKPVIGADGTTPEVFGIKLVAVYLAEDIDSHTDNVGNVARIWTNPACDPDLRHCGIGTPSAPFQVTSYFDLARSTQAVNAELNASAQPVPPGTYRDVRLDFAGIDPPDGVPNLRFGTTEDSRDVRYRDNGLTVALDPAMVIAPGESFLVTLGYDMSHAYYPDPSGQAGAPPAGTSLSDWYCADTTIDPAHGPCLAFTGFTPDVRRLAAPDAGR
jgi:hypothetical protein